MVVTNEQAKLDDDAATQQREVLTWHAAGRLSARDAQRLDEALARDPELARQYAVIQEEYGETVHLNESLGAPSARAMQKLFAAIDGVTTEPLDRGTTDSSWLTFLKNETRDAIHLYFLPITAAARQIASAFLSGPYRPRQNR
jgi:hypothetical protein